VQSIIGLIATMRPKQWVKNGIVFAAIVFDGQLLDPDIFVRVLLALILLISASSSVYIINDIVDIEKDRAHPRKKHRPIPSGKLPLPLAKFAAIVIPLVTIGVSILFDWRLAIIIVLYLLIQVAYSFFLKHVVIIDVLTVASGFVLRVLAGVVVIDVTNFSPWLYACTALLALFLAVGKRRQELIKLGEQAVQTRPIFKHYNLSLLDDMLRMVTTSTLIVYLIYTIEADTIKVADIKLSLITVPFVMYGLLHYLYLIHVKGEGGAPDEVLLKDRPLQITIALWGMTYLVLIYILPRIMG
jgi:4-hydroxybenzoate polyprenyltransferase